MQHQIIILMSTLRTKLRSSASVHVALGSNLHGEISLAAPIAESSIYDLPMQTFILGDGHKIPPKRWVIEDILGFKRAARLARKLAPDWELALVIDRHIVLVVQARS